MMAWEGLYPACVTVGVSDGNADVDTPSPDGLTNFQEMNGGSDPCNTNTDGDACSDGEERGPSRPSPVDAVIPRLDGLGLHDFYDVDGTKKIDGVDVNLVRAKAFMVKPPDARP